MRWILSSLPFLCNCLKTCKNNVVVTQSLGVDCSSFAVIYIVTKSSRFDMTVGANIRGV